MEHMVVDPGRPACPFYGFFRIGMLLMDNRDNACGVVPGGCESCVMEMSRQTPDWQKCPWNNEGHRVSIELALEHCVIFPRELESRGSSELRGVRLREWHELIMHR